MLDTGQIKFAVGIKTPDLACLLARQQPVSADHFAAAGIPYQQMLAMGVIPITVNARCRAGHACAHFLGKHPVTQPLGFEHLNGAAGERHRQCCASACTHFCNFKGMVKHCACLRRCLTDSRLRLKNDSAVKNWLKISDSDIGAVERQHVSA